MVRCRASSARLQWSMDGKSDSHMLHRGIHTYIGVVLPADLTHKSSLNGISYPCYSVPLRLSQVAAVAPFDSHMI